MAPLATSGSAPARRAWLVLAVVTVPLSWWWLSLVMTAPSRAGLAIAAVPLLLVCRAFARGAAASAPDRCRYRALPRRDPRYRHRVRAHRSGDLDPRALGSRPATLAKTVERDDRGSSIRCHFCGRDRGQLGSSDRHPRSMNARRGVRLRRRAAVVVRVARGSPNDRAAAGRARGEHDLQRKELTPRIIIGCAQHGRCTSPSASSR